MRRLKREKDTVENLIQDHDYRCETWLNLSRRRNGAFVDNMASCDIMEVLY